MSDQSTFHVWQDSQSHGPFDAAKLRAMLHEGEINSGTLVALSGGDDWLPLSAFPEIMVAPQKVPVRPRSAKEPAVENLQPGKTPSILRATVLPCVASLAVGIIVTWSIIGTEMKKVREGQNKHEQEAQTEAHAKQELALLVSDCKRMDVTASAIESVRQIQAEQLRRHAQSLDAWIQYHPAHPQMEVAMALRVSLDGAARSIEEVKNEFLVGLATDRMRSAQREAVDCFAILTGLK